MTQLNSDLDVELLSDALSGRSVDFIVTGSIGAIEAPRFIRALRRLGAKVKPWLTQGGAKFITSDSLAWAANCEVQQSFSGTQTHISTGDLCIIAPATSHMIAKIAWGDTDTPASALITSYLGMNKPVYLLPTMHDSLFKAPNTKRNIDTVKTISPWVKFLDVREEEGKQKMSSPESFADQVAQLYNHRPEKILITMGSTRGYIDDVRFVSNYSSGALGTLLSKELYRYGYQVVAISGPAQHKPELPGLTLINVETTDQMLVEVQNLTYDAAVCAASVLDYMPSTKTAGKIRSNQSQLELTLKPTPKIIDAVQPQKKIKIGFKLESEISESDLRPLYDEYTNRYGLSCFVVNKLSDVSATDHRAYIMEDSKSTQMIAGKQKLAQYLTQHIHNKFN